ncbi:hypothetical protein U8607_02255 [Methylobacterium durans]|uniref:HPr kinase/phosphorylase n=1 Tax=Methylobacterium durans TaxID=2202825 RepID=UPI002AFF648F|nr:hypothetical protein [Methylobacterium durans]MEA1830894.1 hypothetical protein [Methylobacterium durans]
MIGEAGILIRGESGSGKSSLALALLDRTERDGGHGRLVGDDRIRVEPHHGRLVARAHPAIAGLVEVRGLGLRAVPSIGAAVLHMVVDCVGDVPRMPEPAEPVTMSGVTLPCLVLGRTLRETGLGPVHVMHALSVASRSHSGIVGQPAVEAP